MEELITMVANVGFPIVVSIFMIVRVDNTIKELLVAITKLTERIDAMEDKHRGE